MGKIYSWYNSLFTIWKFIIILVGFFLAPGLVLCVYNLFIADSKTGSAWIGFFGGYVGSILSISFAYFNTKSQIDSERENQRIKQVTELLPHFYISDVRLETVMRLTGVNGNNSGRTFTWMVGLGYGTLSQSALLVENCEIIVYFNPSFKPVSHSIGHLNKDFEQYYVTASVRNNDLIRAGIAEDKVETEFQQASFDPNRVDITCKTALGNRVYMTYGDGVNGTAFYQDKGGWKLYSGEESQEASRRLYEYEQTHGFGA